jgi:hypothetical protein
VLRLVHDATAVVRVVFEVRERMQVMRLIQLAQGGGVNFTVHAMYL